LLFDILVFYFVACGDHRTVLFRCGDNRCMHDHHIASTIMQMLRLSPQQLYILEATSSPQQLCKCCDIRLSSCVLVTKLTISIYHSLFIVLLPLLSLLVFLLIIILVLLLILYVCLHAFTADFGPSCLLL